jgi:hypothetical protein
MSESGVNLIGISRYLDYTSLKTHNQLLTPVWPIAIPTCESARYLIHLLKVTKAQSFTRVASLLSFFGIIRGEGVLIATDWRVRDAL